MTDGSIAQLSYNQKALWFLHQQEPRNIAYPVSRSIRILSDIDAPALQRALKAVTGRHAILRTVYYSVDGVPYQQVSPSQEAVLGINAVPGISLSGLRELLENDASRPFDLERGPLLRASLYTRGEADHVLLLSLHHIAADGLSMVLFVEELLKTYGELTGGPQAALSQPKAEYADFVRWQEDMLAGPEGERLWSYWRQKLAAPRAQIVLPSGHPRTPFQSFQGASHAFVLEPEAAQKVRNLARRENTTSFVVLLAAFEVLLFKLTGTGDVIVGTSTLARGKWDFMRVLGDFANTVAIRGRLSATMTFSDFVRQLAITVDEAVAAQDFPFPLLVHRLQPERNAGSPLFSTFFNFHRKFRELTTLLAGDTPDGPIGEGGLQLAPFPLELSTGQFELALEMAEIADKFRGKFNYRTALFEKSTIAGFAAQFLALLESLTSDPDAALAAVSCVSPMPAPAEDSVPALLEQLRQRDIRVTLDGGRLRINAPRGALDEDTKATLAARRDGIIDHLKAAATAAKEPALLRKGPRNRPVPASPAQQRLWFLNRIDPGNTGYNIGGGLRLRGLLDIELMKQAIMALTARHEAFRTRIVEHNGEPQLELLETSLARIDIADLLAHPATSREASLQALGEALLKTPFGMAQGQLAAFLIVRLAADEHVLILAMHHAISDGWSLAIACHEICELYDALATGQQAKLAPLSADYIDYAAWEAAQSAAGRFDESLAYWKRQLQGAPATIELPFDRPRPPVPSGRGGRVRRYFDRDLIAALEACSRKQNATLFMTLLAAWQVLMHRYSGQDDIVVGTPVANRDLPEFEGTIGCLVNNIPLRARLDGNPRFDEFLAQVKQTLLDAFDHRALPFDKLVQGLNPERTVSHAPVFQVLFALMSFPVQSLSPAGMSADFVELDNGAARFDLAIELEKTPAGKHAGEFGAVYEYASGLFDDSTIARLHEHFVNLLAAAAGHPHRDPGPCHRAIPARRPAHAHDGAHGLSSFELGFAIKEFTGRWVLMLLGGLIDLGLAALVIAGWLGTGAIILGVYVGINFLFTGFALISAALDARST